MKSDIEKRLAKLEVSRKANEGGPLADCTFSIERFQAAILAVHVGSLKPGEPVTGAHARALGLTPAEYRMAVRSGTWAERHQAAWEAFCTERGFDPDTAEQGETIRFLDTMLQAVPEHVRQGLYLYSAVDSFA